MARGWGVAFDASCCTVLFAYEGEFGELVSVVAVCRALNLALNSNNGTTCCLSSRLFSINNVRLVLVDLARRAIVLVSLSLPCTPTLSYTRCLVVCSSRGWWLRVVGGGQCACLLCENDLLAALLALSDSFQPLCPLSY